MRGEVRAHRLWLHDGSRLIMITATWLGGPDDGKTIDLPDPRPIKIAIATEWRFISDQAIPDPVESSIQTRTIHPRLTEHGWILPWHE